MNDSPDMSGLWGEIAKKLADQWFSLLVLPGVLYLAVVTAALILGHTHPFDADLLAHRITTSAQNPTITSTAGQITLLAAILAGAGGIGLVAQSLGSATEYTVLSTGLQSWPAPARYVAQCLIANRRRRWAAADGVYRAEYDKALTPNPTDRPDPAVRHRAARRRTRIAVEPPERPTWSSDRIHTAAVRLDRTYHLDLATVWPALWLLLPDPTRSAIAVARTTLSQAATLAAWSLLYLPLAGWWWPAAPLSAILAFTARHRIRNATDTYATLLETAVHLHATTLATQLGVENNGALTPPIGHALTHRLSTPLPLPDR
ncbi:hypothetical protein [Nocardia sp. NPDC004604]|uniref:hypothetical protein n=1 Tax=Nocardia sp. NPDC004604 TaxID=3157013 RepID=UPI0033B5A507